MPRPLEQSLPLRHALALGLMHGPAELLPISSSGHTTLVPWLLGWPYPELDPALRKSFEVALHAGTAVGLLIALRSEVGEAAASFDRRRAILIAGSFIPPAIVGYTLEGPIEKRLGTPARQRWRWPISSGRRRASAMTQALSMPCCWEWRKRRL